jgi:alkylhydroperoxidase family enzyme
MSSVPRTSRGADGRPIGLADVAPELAAAQAAFQRVAYPGAVDLVTRELVRILSGRLAHCTICRNLRLNAAVKRGFDESMTAHLEDPEHAAELTDRQRAALRLANAFFDDPGGFSADAQADLLANFEPAEAAELLLDLIRFRPGSKLTVAAGTEPSTDELIYQ